MKCQYFAAAALCAVSIPAYAQTEDLSTVFPTAKPPAERITVVATGSPRRIDQTGQPITVLTAADLERLQGPDITRALEQVPGLTLSRNGGPGAFTGVRLRGSDSEQVLVLIDGVRVEDVSAPGAGFDFGTLTTGGIERIDVLRGSNSVTWGSAALGGVIAIQTREPDGLEASAEGGSRGSFAGDAAAGVKRQSYALSLTGGYTTTDGVSAAAVGTEPDGARQWHLGGKARLDLLPGLSLVANARYADTRTEIDGYPAPNYTFADTPEYQTTRQLSGRAGLRYEGALVTVNTGFALSDTKRDYYDPTLGTAPSYGYRGRSHRADLTGRARLPADFALDFGADSEWTRYSGTFDAERRARQTSGHAMLGWYTPGISLAAGLRYDDHSRFGHATTLGANGTARLADGLRLRASYGEGFKAPTLFQLLSDYGNAALRPERSRSYDAGLAYSSGPVTAAVTVYRRDSRNLIAFVSCFGQTTGICAGRPFGTYDNVGKARAEGLEAELTLKPAGAFTVRSLYTYTRSRDLGTGHDLARRPRHALTLSGDLETRLAGLALGADLRLVSSGFDNAANTVRLPGGAVATLRASLPVNARFTLYARVENVFDTRLPTAAGYSAVGRGAFAGLRVRY
ncbi:TonB-dependent receptor [Novosphingobium fuchskuhlense]|uniref:TonB-dependent receptor n=1 Tax=Novosphingobium fuchskuhlense TaxID=1117702 RepID=A0A117USZ7_9SPHN|nr:TonB-dependent receptor [Novosphingobium fuchskuhlense]KUR70305.1 TonB-dependent receptor [Novosphingobium fuchskuhlense]